MSLATGVHLWKVFFANRKVGPSHEKNTPKRISSRTELHEFTQKPTHLSLLSSGVNVKSHNGNEKNKHTPTNEFIEQQFHVDADSKNFSFGRKRDGSINSERNDDNSPDVSNADIFVQVIDTRRHHDNGSQGSKDDIITITDIKASVEPLHTKRPDINHQKQTPGSSECNMINLKCDSKTSRNTITTKTTNSHSRKSWEIQAFITCIIISLHTIICTGPVVCSIWVEVFQGSTVGYQARVITFIFFLINSLSNPFIYAWRIPEIRQEFRRLFRLNN
ncbi:ADORA2A [Mytilus coruscus]|uniref:ADORA2A n=1 Tax=Mytilus coruscus TaxID=42192 RepID=A0A6J8CSK5_MYTCO|nr:ADORA2A [Mytilus coruscus]